MHDGVRSSAWPFECGRALFLRVRSVAGIRVMSMMCAVRCVPVVCGGVLSVEVLSQITPTLQTRPGARRREPARARADERGCLCGTGLHVAGAPRRASSTSNFAKSLRSLSAAFGRFRPSVPFAQSRGARTPQCHVQCALAPDTPLADSVASSPLAHCRQTHGHPRPSAHRPETVWCVQCRTV